jgi:hypothetical protein
MCLACTVDPLIMGTEEINILDEPLLVEGFKRITQAFDSERNQEKAN